jgi:hypothetical protein
MARLTELPGSLSQCLGKYMKPKKNEVSNLEWSEHSKTCLIQNSRDHKEVSWIMKTLYNSILFKELANNLLKK